MAPEGMKKETFIQDLIDNIIIFHFSIKAEEIKKGITDYFLYQSHQNNYVNDTTPVMNEAQKTQKL